MLRMIAVLVGGFWSVSAFCLTYEVDTQKSSVKWVGKKLSSQHEGTVGLKSGNFDLEGATAKGEFIFDINSITDTDMPDKGDRAKLEGHLKSDDFFNVKKFPTAKFTLESAKKLTGNDYEFAGQLTIKNITKPLIFKGTLTTDDKGSTLVAKANFDRTVYDMHFNSGKFFDIKTLGEKLVKDDVEIELNIQSKLKGKAS